MWNAGQCLRTGDPFTRLGNVPTQVGFGWKLRGRALTGMNMCMATRSGRRERYGVYSCVAQRPKVGARSAFRHNWIIYGPRRVRRSRAEPPADRLALRRHLLAADMCSRAGHLNNSFEMLRTSRHWDTSVSKPLRAGSWLNRRFKGYWLHSHN